MSSFDSNPDPKYKPNFHLNKRHDRLFVFDLEAAQNSLEFLSDNGSVLCHDTVPSEFLTKVINPKDGSQRSGKAECKEELPSRKKKSQYDHGQSSYQCQRPTLPSLHESDAASFTVDGDVDDEHPHSRQRMHAQKIITSPCGYGID